MVLRVKRKASEILQRQKTDFAIRQSALEKHKSFIEMTHASYINLSAVKCRQLKTLLRSS